MIKDLKELYAYRQMIFSLVKKDLRGRYKGSVLGFMWTFINPLLQMGVYTLVFSIILRNDIDKYYLFLFVALVPWIFFSASLTGTATGYVCGLFRRSWYNVPSVPIRASDSAKSVSKCDELSRICICADCAGTGTLTVSIRIFSAYSVLYSTRTLSFDSERIGIAWRQHDTASTPNITTSFFTART